MAFSVILSVRSHMYHFLRLVVRGKEESDLFSIKVGGIARYLGWNPCHQRFFET